MCRKAKRKPQIKVVSFVGFPGYVLKHFGVLNSNGEVKKIVISGINGLTIVGPTFLWESNSCHSN